MLSLTSKHFNVFFLLNLQLVLINNSKSLITANLLLLERREQQMKLVRQERLQFEDVGVELELLNGLFVEHFVEVERALVEIH